MKDKPHRLDAQPEESVLSHPWVPTGLGNHSTQSWGSWEATSRAQPQTLPALHLHTESQALTGFTIKALTLVSPHVTAGTVTKAGLEAH